MITLTRIYCDDCNKLVYTHSSDSGNEFCIPSSVIEISEKSIKLHFCSKFCFVDYMLNREAYELFQEIQ